MRNVRLAFRILFRSPFVTTVAILSLALGIGANAAIFSLFNQILLRPLPVEAPERLVNLRAPGPNEGSVSCNDAGCNDEVFSYPLFRDLERGNRVFTGIAAHRSIDANLSFRGQTLSGEGMVVSGSYFPVLGLRPALGRLLGPADDRTVGGHFVTVLSHRYWQERFGADPGVLNQPIVVNGQTLTIVGVAPAGFQGTTAGLDPQLFVPMTMMGLMQPGFEGFEDRRNHWAYLFARLEPGVTLEQARSAINGVYRPIIREVEAPLQEGMDRATLARFRAKEIELDDGRRGQSAMHEEARTPLMLLFCVTGIVLLIACANIANLLLARGVGRRMEIAVRLSLGASRRQVLAQLLTEACVLAVLGGAAGIYAAWGTLSLIGAMLPPETALKLELSWPVVLFAAALSIGTGVLFGLFPALHSTRPDLVTTIRANAGQITGARAASRFRNGLVTVQVALSMLLLISAGFFLKSLTNVSRIDLGVRTDRVVTFAVSPQLNGYAPERSAELFERMADALAAEPGVVGVTSARVPILAGSYWSNNVSVEGFHAAPGADTNAGFNQVGPGYFRTLGIPLLGGREFTAADREGAPRVAIVNEAFVKRFDLGRDAVGKRMARGSGGELDIEIVGIAQDAKYNDVKEAVPPLYFTPHRQDEGVGALSFYVRTAADPEALLRRVPGVVARLDPNLPVEELKTLPQQVRESVALDRLITMLSAVFAALATLLAAVGLYGVLAYSVAQRTREIGVRMALGAGGASIRALVLRQVGRMIVVGGVVGIAGALGLGRVVGSLLYGVQGGEPLVVVAAAALLCLVALGAGYIPARRAARISPMQALRYE